MNTVYSLSSLSLDETGVLVSVPKDHVLRRRLFDLGFLPDTPIQCILSDSHDETAAYRIRGTTIALRKEDAEQIVIHRHRPCGQS
ncbi:MAG: ferrous iron transport protein A [Lachnospiraceae bacterium]|nr:ferrous iron transport protein A [Lachnospiraceae bacterium]